MKFWLSWQILQFLSHKCFQNKSQLINRMISVTMIFQISPLWKSFFYQKYQKSARYYSISKSNKISFDQGSELKTPQPILPHLRVKRSLTHKMVSRDIFLISGLRNLGSKKICTFENYGLGIIWFLIQYRKLLIHFLFDSLQIFTEIYHDSQYTVAPHLVRSCTRCTESKSKIRFRTI